MLKQLGLFRWEMPEFSLANQLRYPNWIGHHINKMMNILHPLNLQMFCCIVICLQGLTLLIGMLSNSMLYDLFGSYIYMTSKNMQTCIFTILTLFVRLTNCVHWLYMFVFWLRSLNLTPLLVMGRKASLLVMLLMLMHMHCFFCSFVSSAD